MGKVIPINNRQNLSSNKEHIYPSLEDKILLDLIDFAKENSVEFAEFIKKRSEFKTNY
jgi:hypothetical protein